MQPHILKITPFKGDGSAVAAVQVLFGPVKINTRLVRTGESYFLGMPGRYSEEEQKWFNSCEVTDRRLLQVATELACKAYQKADKPVAAAV